jgi:hypothetical protein
MWGAYINILPKTATVVMQFVINTGVKEKDFKHSEHGCELHKFSTRRDLK